MEDFSVIINEEVQSWIIDNLSKDSFQLALQTLPFPEIEKKMLLQQLSGKQVSKNKFPKLFNKENIVYPPKLNLEQTSSEVTAVYKSNLIKGKTAIDLTGGFGIDSIAFTEKFEEVTHVEQSTELQSIAAFNFEQLGLNNLKSIAINSNDFLENSDKVYDLIYIDPSRRNINQQKVFKLEDITPNPLDFIDLWLSKSENILIKLSPLLDIKYIIQCIPNVNEIHIVSVKNEVKELLVCITKNKVQNPKIICTNLETNHKQFVFDFYENELLKREKFSEVQKYLYEPNASIHKSKGYEKLIDKYNLKAIHSNTHIFTSDELIQDFPGIILSIKDEIKNPKKELKNKSIRVILRNYPEPLANLRKKYKFTSDGTNVIVFTKSLNKSHIFLCEIVDDIICSKSI